jgi:hypothetical protein
LRYWRYKKRKVGAIYEIWNLETGNLVGAYDTPNEALVDIRQTLDRDGEGSIEHLALAREDATGETKRLAEGHDLAEWAKRAHEQGETKRDSVKTHSTGG